MTTKTLERYDRIAGAFTRRVEAVPADAWDAPAPCEGWVARDVVGHLVEWMPSLIESGWGVTVPPHPTVDDDPVAAWAAVDAAIRRWLADPALATREADIFPGRYSFEQAVDTFCTGDLLVHTWDLARATGLDEMLDPDEVHRMFEAMQPMDEVLRASGHYGPRVPVAADADEQTKLIAFTGRRP
ncbi:MAG TPA: TIGR03086 family metal-binding protein [Acidimicrobiia bacterium]|nr:TIGR03086 family metal-binding protein [Acidimicrobiia bacterium]